MGGVSRVIKSVFTAPKTPAPVQVAQPQTAPEPKTQVQPETQMKAKMVGAGYGGQTILSGATGVEEEANIAKTVLGGGKKKNIIA